MNNVEELTYYTIAFLQITEQQVGFCFALLLSVPCLYILCNGLNGPAEKVFNLFIFRS